MEISISSIISAAFCGWVLYYIYSIGNKTYDFTLIPAENRNIIFVGRSRSGKSTLIEVLKDKDYDPGFITILRGTAYPKLESFTMRSDTYSSDLHFNIMDTPGLFEHTVDINDKRSNDIILNVIKTCIDLEITKINHVYFVMTIQRGLNMQDIAAFNLFTELFVGMEDKISIILSFSQTITPEQYDHYINQFKETPELKRIHDTINGRIFFLGAIQKGDAYDIRKLQKNVYTQRSGLFQHIIKQSSTYSVKQLKVYKEQIKYLQTLRKTLNKCCKNNCIDLSKFDSLIRNYTINDNDDNL